jgi:hypothetical protein
MIAITFARKPATRQVHIEDTIEQLLKDEK